MRYRMGDLVELVTETNSDLKYGLNDIVGVTLEKQMIPTIANLTQTDLDDFIIVHPKDFVYNPRTHGKKIGLGFNTTDRCFISTWNNNTFRVKPQMMDVIIPEFLYMHFLRDRWDKEACFNAWGSSTVVLLWSSFCDMKINVPPISEQRKIVHEYQVITDRIELLRKINENLEETTQVAFNNTFFKFPGSANLIKTKLGSLPDYISVKSFKDINTRVENGARPAGGACDHGFPSLGADCAKGLGCYDETKAKYVPEEYAQKMKRGIVTGYELLVYKDGGTPSNFIPDFSIYGEGYPFDRFAINEHVFIIDFGSPASNWFAYFLFKSKYVYGELAALGGKSAIPGISQSDLEELYLIDPTCDIAKSFGNKYLPFLKTILINCKEILSLNKLQKSVLPSIAKGA